MAATTAAPPAAPAVASLEKVRVESDTSMGRSYSKKIEREEGIGEKRKTWTQKSFSVEDPVSSSLTYSHCNLKSYTRDDTLAYFRNTWALTDALFSGYNSDSVFYIKPDQLRRPMVFYYGHAACVYANKMNLAGLMPNVNMLYQKMFETGVDEMSWDDMDDMQDADYPWPDIPTTQKWRETVKEIVEKKIADMPVPTPGEPITMASPYWALWMGMEHERIHLETSSVLTRQLSVKDVSRPKGWKYAPSNASTPEEAPVNELVDVAAATAVLGKPVDFPSYGWDDEYGRRDVEVDAFRASKFLVTNAEYLPFVLDGGYETKKWWISPSGDDEGWRWLTFRGQKHPLWWVATSHPDMERFCGQREGAVVGHRCESDDGSSEAGDGPQFRYRAIFDIIDMPWDWPVDVNYLEARAFLNWKGEKDGCVYRMPTEAEHNLMRAEPNPFDEEVRKREDYEEAVDVIMRKEAPGNVNMRFGSSSPVDMFEPSAAGFYDIHGNVWEYVEDHFGPLPDFKIHYLYDDFSTPCFDGWHTMIMGGSWASTGDQASAFARYAFRRHFQQHLGFRYVTSEAVAKEEYPGQKTVANLWEGGGKLSEDLDSAFTPRTDLIPESIGAPAGGDYGHQLRELVARFAGGAGGAGDASGRVLHLGCGVGRVTMELTKSFSEVVGVDKDEPLIRHARVLQHHGNLKFERVSEGVLKKTHTVEVPREFPRERASFILADVTTDTGEIAAAGPFDVVIVDGLLDRLRQPLDLVRKLESLVAVGGHLVVSSANDWQSSVTPRNSWFGGFEMNGEAMDTLTMQKTVYKKFFELVDVQDVPRIKRRHERKFDLSLMQVSVWKRK